MTRGTNAHLPSLLSQTGPWRIPAQGCGGHMDAYEIAWNTPEYIHLSNFVINILCFRFPPYVRGKHFYFVNIRSVIDIFEFSTGGKNYFIIGSL